MNKSVLMLSIDPLNWEHPHLLGPSLQVTDDVDPLKWRIPYVLGPRLRVRGT